MNNNKNENKSNTKELRRKAEALATATILGASVAGISSALVNRYKDEAVENTTKILTKSEINDIYEGYNGDEPIYVKAGKFIKCYEDADYQEYLRVFSTSTYAEKDDLKTTYSFKTPEFYQPMYVPKTDVLEFVSLTIKTDDPTAECTNLRMTPERTSNNILKKIDKDDTIYINLKNCQTEDISNAWYEAIYNDNGQLIKGYFCDNQDEMDNQYIQYTFDRYTFAYVPADTRLYSEKEINNMKYEVIKDYGVIFTETLGSYDDAIIVPYGTIVIGEEDTTISKANNKDDFLWLKCKLMDSGVLKEGYIQYRSKNKEFLIRVPQEVNKQEIRKQR